MAPHPAQVRHQKTAHAAVRAALAGDRLTADQLKHALHKHDALQRASDALMAQHGEVFARARAGEGADALAAVSRRLDHLDNQIREIDERSKKLRLHPQVRAAILERERQECRQ
jgi:uncharacterized protein YicC (UPF0701 family)